MQSLRDSRSRLLRVIPPIGTLVCIRWESGCGGQASLDEPAVVLGASTKEEFALVADSKGAIRHIRVSAMFIAWNSAKSSD